MARIEEIMELIFNGFNFSEDIMNRKDLSLVLIGNGSKLFDKNSLHLDEKYNFKEISFYEETDIEICIAGLIFEKNFQEKNNDNLTKSKKKLGIFQKFFNIFSNY